MFFTPGAIPENCRWSDVATAQARVHEQIEVLEDALLEISRRRIMVSMKVVGMRAIATLR